MTKRTAIWVAAIAGLAAVLTVLVAGAGLRFYTVMTPSMGQTAPVGTLVITRPAASYGVSDIITFEHDGRSYTHRIIAQNSNGTFTTKGDLNPVADPLPVAPDQIIGLAAALLPGFGWLWQGLPWLIVGGILVYLLSLIRHLERSWRWVVRISGWTLTLALVAIWLRPWVSLSMLGYTPAVGGGVDMHVVNTGLFPLDVLDNRLVSGQDTVVLVTETDAQGHYTLTPGLAFHWWEQLVIYLLCLVPMALSFLIRDEPTATPTRALIEPENDENEELAPDSTSDEPDGSEDSAPDDGPVDEGSGNDDQTLIEDKRRRRRILLIGALVVAILVGVAVVTFSTTSSAVTARISNNTNTAGSRTHFSCRRAETSLSGSTYFAYALGTTGNNETDMSSGGHNGTYATSATRTADYGCRRDTPQYSVTFNGSQCLYQTSTTSVNNPTVFSLEAWFKTATQPNGKLIGFGTSRNSDADNQYDRHLYFDAAGRIIFGVYPGEVKIISSPAGVDYADNTWHHVVATLSSAGMRLYVDGNLVSSDATVTTAEGYAGYWKVGCGNLNGWRSATSTTNDFNGPRYFTGSMQYAAVYTVALTATQVREHYLAGVS